MTMTLSGRARLGLAAAALFGLSSAAQAQKTHEFDGVGATIPGATTFGPASVYPSSVTVSGLTAPVAEVKVRLNGLSHTFAEDLVVLLVAPGGEKSLLTASCGGGSDYVNADLLFAGDAPTVVGSSVASGRYRPSACNPFANPPAPAPAGPHTADLGAFRGTNPNGTWSLYVYDQFSGDIGTLVSWSLLITESASVVNSRPIAIPAAGSSGPSNPYPAPVIVDGLTGTVTNVEVMLMGLSHTFMRDLEVLLVAPGGQTCLLTDDCGDGVPGVSNIDLIFSDNAAGSLAQFTIPAAGAYKPSQCGSPTLPAPAPAGPYGTTLAAFDGANPNGVWRLFVNDDAGGDLGSIARGWALVINGQLCPADFNKSGLVSVQDIFDFLAAYFAGCP